MTSKQAYRLFLQSDFWLQISAQKRALVGSCEKCGSVHGLQAHHLFYRHNWYLTELGDLQVLCRECHELAHGITRVPFSRIFLYRNDLQFSRFLHWMGVMVRQMYGSGRTLQPSRIWYLQQALVLYPPTKKDSCMKFHVQQTLSTNQKCPSFYEHIHPAILANR